MPAKKPMSEEEKKLIVRQEGRRGFLKVKQQMIDEVGKEKLEDIFIKVEFQIFGKSEKSDHTEYYGYCPLFAPLSFHEKTLNYVMRLDLREEYPIVEFFIMGEVEK
jgi:hypothetical protein